MMLLNSSLAYQQQYFLTSIVGILPSGFDANERSNIKDIDFINENAARPSIFHLRRIALRHCFFLQSFFPGI